MSDPVAEMLRRSPITNSQRADLWDAYESSGDEDELTAVLTPLKIPRVVKARLWDLKAAKATATTDPDVGSLSEEPRTPPVGIDPRLEPESMMNEAQTRELRDDTAAGLFTMGTVAAGGPIGRALASPITSGLYAGGRVLYKTGDPWRAVEVGLGVGATHKVGAKILSGALAARLEHQVARAAVAEAPAVAKAAGPIAKATEAEIEALLIRATDSTAPLQVRIAARSALQKAGWTPDAGMMATPIVEEAAPAAAPVVRKLAPIPEKGNVKMATVYTRPKGLPPQQSEAATKLRISASGSLAEQQAEAAKAAGMDIGEAFGTTAPKAATPVGQAVESALETRLRASVLMRKDKAALANEIGAKVLALRSAGGKAASAEKIAAAIEELYGLPSANVKQMVQMVLREAGK